MKHGKGDIITNSIRKNLAVFLAATIFFCVGLAVGAFVVKSLNLNQKQDLILYLNKFFQIMDKENIKSTSIFFQSVKNNFQTVFFIWILSITVIGIPVTLFIISFRGFIIGFTVAFFVQGMGWKGLLLTILAVLPQNIIYIPCLIAIAAISLNYSINVLKRNVSNGVVNQLRNNIFTYSMNVGIIFACMLVGSLFEAYLSPALLKSISNYMIIQ